MQFIHTILLPTRPQPDTVVAIFLLKAFGGGHFEGIRDARIAIRAEYKEIEEGVLAMDVGGGVFDHHGTDFCTTEIVAKYLSIEKDPALAQLLTYARRDDKEGRGIISKDGIDRAFGLSGLIASLNKTTQDAQYIVDSVMPLLDAHYQAANEHHVVLPRDVAEKKKKGHYEEFTVEQGTKRLKVACVLSDKPSMPGYLRSMQGPRADVIVQRCESSNHTCILSKRESAVDFSKVAGMVRMREGELRGVEFSQGDEYVMQTGNIEEITIWYFDPATNSVLNGGPHNKRIEPSVIPWDELKLIVRGGLSL